MDIPTSPAKKILVIEDDQFLRDLYHEILTGAGYMVDLAEDGETGFDRFHQGGYDLVLLDIMLPKMDGLAILKKAVAEPPLIPNKAVIVLSNLGQESVIADAIDLGARGYMIKSELTPDQALNEIRSYLTDSP